MIAPRKDSSVSNDNAIYSHTFMNRTRVTPTPFQENSKSSNQIPGKKQGLPALAKSTKHPAILAESVDLSNVKKSGQNLTSNPYNDSKDTRFQF